MAVSLEDVDRWLLEKETEHLEFKEAKTTFAFDDVKRYVVALGNEGGGHLVLGVTPRLPRRVVGSQAFRDVGELKKRLYDVYRRVFEVDEVQHPDGRVVVVHIASRPVGLPLQMDGAYLMRAGESVVPMSADRLKAIFDEASPDFSSEVCRSATADDLDDEAVRRLIELWSKKTGDEQRRNASPMQVLADLALVEGARVTHAALILLGKAASLRRLLADAEIVWEFRGSEAAIEHAQRTEWRAGFLRIMDEVWNAIAARNEVHHLQEGLFVRDIPALREDVVREAILNAVCHRDYRQPGSIFVTQSPRRLIVASPGGLPRGVTVENIVMQRHPRNRLLAETLQHIGLVERSGQGMDKIFRRSIEDGKLPPDFTGTDAHNVVIALFGEIEDARFVQYLARIGQEKLARFSTLDFIVLDHVRRDAPVPPLCQARIPALVTLGVIERVGRKLILSKALYAFLGERGRYSRARGLDRETQKALIEQHLREVADPEGAGLDELRQVLGPAVPARRVQRLLHEMRSEGRLLLEGRTRAARWRLVRSDGRT